MLFTVSLTLTTLLLLSLIRRQRSQSSTIPTTTITPTLSPNVSTSDNGNRLDADTSIMSLFNRTLTPDIEDNTDITTSNNGNEGAILAERAEALLPQANARFDFDGTPFADIGSAEGVKRSLKGIGSGGTRVEWKGRRGIVLSEQEKGKGEEKEVVEWVFGGL